MIFNAFAFSMYCLEPHGCHNVVKKEEIIYQNALKPVSLTFFWNTTLVEDVKGIIFGPVRKCFAKRAVTVTMASGTKHCPLYTGYEWWCDKETKTGVKNNTNGSIKFTIEFSAESVLNYLCNLTRDNCTVLFSARLLSLYGSTSERASDRNIEVQILGGLFVIHTSICIHSSVVIILILEIYLILYQGVECTTCLLSVLFIIKCTL